MSARHPIRRAGIGPCRSVAPDYSQGRLSAHVARTCIAWLSLTALTLLSLTASADIRVLMAFDASGHRLQRLLHVEAASMPESMAGPGAASAAEPEAPGGLAMAEWLDAAGELLVQTHFPDPRVVHGPALASGVPTAGQRVRLEQGAYLLSGPDAAFTLRITLPYSGVPAMEQSVWDVALVP